MVAVASQSVRTQGHERMAYHIQGLDQVGKQLMQRISKDPSGAYISNTYVDRMDQFGMAQTSRNYMS